MKAKRKSAIIGRVIVTAAVAGLIAACDSTNAVEWPHIWGPNEVPQNVANEPRAVQSAPAPPPDTPYPRLGDVPMKPKDFTPAPTIVQTKLQMEEERVESQKIKTQVAADPNFIASESASDQSLSFAATAALQYAFQVTGSEVYTFIVSKDSPAIGSIQLPISEDAEKYVINFLSGQTYSPPIETVAYAKVPVPARTTGIKVTLLDKYEERLKAPSDFTFYVSFAAGGPVTANIAGNELKTPDAYAQSMLPQGGNPPISGTTNATPHKE